MDLRQLLLNAKDIRDPVTREDRLRLVSFFLIDRRDLACFPAAIRLVDKAVDLLEEAAKTMCGPRPDRN